MTSPRERPPPRPPGVPSPQPGPRPGRPRSRVRGGWPALLLPSSQGRHGQNLPGDHPPADQRALRDRWGGSRGCPALARDPAPRPCCGQALPPPPGARASPAGSRPFKTPRRSPGLSLCRRPGCSHVRRPASAVSPAPAPSLPSRPCSLLASELCRLCFGGIPERAGGHDRGHWLLL